MSLIEPVVTASTVGMWVWKCCDRIVRVIIFIVHKYILRQGEEDKRPTSASVSEKMICLK